MKGICNICEGNTLKLESGRWFCEECFSLQQELCETKKDVHEIDSSIPHKYALLGRPLKHSQKVVDVGEPWIYAEAFNIILQKQVEILIQLGASPSLKEVVLNLWARYLQLNGTAFQNIAMLLEKHKKCSPAIPRNRDVEVHQLGRKWVSNHRVACKNSYVKPYRKSKKSNGATPKTSSKNIEETEYKNESALSLVMKLDKEEKKFIKEHLKTNEEDIVLSDSSINGDLPDTKEEDSIKERTNYQVFKELLQKDRRYLTKFAGKQVEYMTVRKTLCFCYLGLLLLKESILLSDLLRWCKAGVLPFFDAGNCLPPSMKLQAADIPYFQIQELPNPSYIDLETGKLAHYLGVSTIPPQRLEPIVARHLKELNLPSEILSLVKSLIDIFPPTNEWNFNNVGQKVKEDEKNNSESLSIPPFEARSISYVIVALKLLFGLDGTTEREMSNHLKKISKFLPKDVNIFSFEDWMQYIDTRNVFLSSRYTTFCFPNTDKIIDVDEFFAFYQCVSSKWHPPEPATKKTSNRCHSRKYHLALQDSFVRLNKKTVTPTSTDCTNTEQNKPSSQMNQSISPEFHSSLHSFCNAKKDKTEENPSNILEANQDLQNKCYKKGIYLKKSLHSFLSVTAYPRRLAVERKLAHKSQYPSLHQDFRNSTVLFITSPHIFTQSLLVKLGKKERALEDKALEHITNIVKNGSSTAKTIDFWSSPEVKEELIQFFRAHSMYWTKHLCLVTFRQVSKVEVEKLPYSFNLLLGACCDLLQMPPFELYSHVIQTEKVLCTLKDLHEDNCK
ncbi:TATA box-binding protein-associated factor RNA polymerase I subunit B-like [Limulus polyphemus]|uniref:TATA box-binding protein-associated factor RNA polymerase I subunit B-like n=1 Tax=Limulus polyphemus TaxID=6850 RepID=A0ABM1SA36_LIMPO|nr:TATA box-binding protein-associated factor RNA polymerase I subunit B-like [Limulus polyphemus]